MHEHRILILAGPNGAGKTTFARNYLIPEKICSNFINADLIAAGLSPFSPESEAIQAGKLMLRQMVKHFKQRDDFAFETTLAGRSYAKKIPEWQAVGYTVLLCFLALPTPETAVDRVRFRVAQGGHNIAKDVIIRRFKAGLNNFHNLYKPIVDSWWMYDNSEDTPILLEKGGPNEHE